MSTRSEYMKETNIKEKMMYADILIVGTAIKIDGKLDKPVDVNRARKIILKARG